MRLFFNASASRSIVLGSSSTLATGSGRFATDLNPVLPDTKSPVLKGREPDVDAGANWRAPALFNFVAWLASEAPSNGKLPLAPAKDGGGLGALPTVDDPDIVIGGGGGGINPTGGGGGGAGTEPFGRGGAGACLLAGRGGKGATGPRRGLLGESSLLLGSGGRGGAYSLRFRPGDAPP